MAHNEPAHISKDTSSGDNLFWKLRRRYVPVRRLGEGGQGAVHLVEDRYLGGRRLAFKILHPKADKAWRDLFRHEFEVLAGLKHPRLSEVHDFGAAADGRVFFTRDYLPGEDLKTAARGMGVSEVISLFAEVCRALRPLHDRGLIHGDLKPGNIICSPDNIARLIDFSFVRGGDEDAGRRGTVPYMAPEIIEKKRSDARADLYSLGATMFEVISGELPFEGPVSEIVQGHLGAERPVPEPKRLVVLPQDAEPVRLLQGIIGRLLSLNPDERFPNVVELEAALAGASSLKVSAEPPQDFPVLSDSLGRDKERAAVQDAVRARLTPSDLSPLAVLEGPLGTGKSALLRNVKWRAQLASIPVIETRGAGLLRPVADIIEQAISYLEEDSPEQRDAEQLLITLSGPERTFAHLDVIAKSAAEILIRIARRAELVVIFGGLEQASFETLTVLRGIIAAAEHNDPIAVIASAEDSFAWRDYLVSGESIAMSPLTVEQVSHTARCFLGRADEEAAKRIWAHTGGNPLFVTALLTDLCASAEGAARLERLGPPKQFETYWQERLSLLTAGERAVVEASAVLGRPASLKELARVAALEEHVTERELSTLALGRWIRQSSSGWTLAAASLDSAIRAAAPPSRLKAMHRRAADLDTDEAEKLYHAAECGDKERVRKRGVAVAVSLRRLGALHAAQNLLTAMRRALKGDPADTPLALELGRVCSAAGDFEDAKKCLEPLVDSELPDVRREALILLGRLYISSGSLDAAESYIDAVLKTNLTPLDRARALFEQASIAFKRQDMPACIAAAKNGLKEAPREHRVRADLLGMSAKAAIREGRKKDALLFAEAAESAAREAADMRAVALSVDILAWVYQRSGDLKKAAATLERAAALHFEFGDMPALMRDRLVLGDLKLWLEDWTEALCNYEQAVRLARVSVNPVLRLNVHNNYGYALIKLGCFERARLVLGRALSEAEALGREDQRLWSLFHLAALAAARGEADQAVAVYTQAKRGFETLKRPAIICEIELETAGCLLRRGNPNDILEAAALLESAGRREREEEGRLFEEASALQRGALLIAQGRVEEGVEILDALCEKTEQKGLLDFAWQAHSAAAKGLLSNDAVFTARKRLRRAEDILERLFAALAPPHRAAFWQDVRRAEVRDLLGEISSSNRFSSAELRLGADSDMDAEARALYRVLELNKQLLTERSLDSLLGMVLSSAIELTGAERGMILMPPEGKERGTLEVRASSEPGSAGDAESDERFSRSIAESVFLDSEPVVTVDAVQDARFREFASIHELNLKSAACLPISCRGRSIGVLYLENRLRRGRFGGRDLRVLAAFADQAAAALSQNRLLCEIRDQAMQLKQTKERLQEAYDRQLEDLNLRDTDLKLARERIERMRRSIEGEGDYHGVQGASKAMRDVFAVAERVKDLNVPVVFVGESGTGKDLLARVLHEQSNLKDGPFVTASCGSIPETLVESALFGHEKGSFSGADSDRNGLLKAADGGTLYLDEIGDMSFRMQVDLLRVLQEGSFTPVGSQKNIRINLRILTSSRVPLDRLVEEGGLRRDLLYRLQVVTIELPPLCKRKEDILPLARRIFEREAARFGAPNRTFSKEAAQALLGYSWPGNIRELEQIIRRVIAVGEGPGPVRADELFAASEKTPFPRKQSAAFDAHRENEEEARILSALEEHKWNRSKAAEHLGIPRRTFYRRLEKMGLIKKR